MSTRQWSLGPHSSVRVEPIVEKRGALIASAIIVHGKAVGILDGSRLGFSRPA